MINLFLFVLIMTVGGCGPGTTTGNPVTPVELRMVDKQPFAWLKNTLDALVPPAHAAVTNVKFCFKRLRLKPDSLTDGEDFELILGQIDIDPNGTTLLTVAVPPGIYQEIEFDLAKDCDGVPGKNSVSFTNNNGSFATVEDMTIEFDGVYTVSAAGTLTLNIDPLFDALELVTANNQIKPGLEDANGDF